MSTVVQEPSTPSVVSLAPAQVKLFGKRGTSEEISKACKSSSAEVAVCGDVVIVRNSRNGRVDSVHVVDLTKQSDLALRAQGIVISGEEIRDAFDRLKGIPQDEPSFVDKFRSTLNIPAQLSEFAAGLVEAFSNQASSQSESELYMPKGSLYTLPDKSGFVLGGDTFLAKIPLQTRDSAPELPAVLLRSELDENALARDPEFRILTGECRGWPLHNGKLLFSIDSGHLEVIRLEDKQSILAVPAASYALNPVDKDQVVVLEPDGTLTEYSLSGLLKGVEVKRTIRQGDGSADYLNVDFDRTGKMLVVSAATANRTVSASYVSPEDGTTHCTVVTRERPILAGDGTLLLDNTGKVFHTNLGAFLEAQERSAHVQTESILNEHLRSIIEQTEVGQSEKETAPSNNDVVEGGDAGQQDPAQTLVAQFGPQISEADQEQLSLITRRVQGLKSRPELASFPDIFIPVENCITARQTQLTADLFIEKLSGLTTALGGSVQVLDVKRAKATLAEFKEWRSSVVVAEESVTVALTEAATRCESAYADALNKIQAALKISVESRVGQLARKLSFVHSFAEFDDVQGEFERTDYRELCELLLATQVRVEMQGRVDKAFAEKRTSLESQSSNLKSERDEQAKKQEESLRDLCGRTLESLGRVANPASLEVWQKSNPLYQEFNRALVGASHHLVVELRASFEQALVEKQRGFGAVGLGHFANYVRDGYATFGKQRLTVFPGYSGLAIPTVVPSHIGSPLGRLRFTGIGGMAYRPDAELLPIQIDHPVTKEAIAKYRPEALSAFAHRARAVPLARSTWRITPWVEQNLEKLAWAINLVQARGQGLVILESEPGLGKNILLEMVACATNRELLTQPFYKQMTIDDLTFMATLNDNNTELVPAKFFNYVQTPGAIVFLDEFSAASDALQKKLNGLFTQDRTLSVSFGDDAKADRSTIFIAAINPLGTGGTNALNEDLKSRSIRVKLSFPEFKETVGGKSRLRSDEAEILYQYIECLKELTIDEFRACWNKVVNKEGPASVDQLLTKERVKAVENMKVAIDVANKVRAAAKETARGATVAIPVYFTWGMRQQEYIAAALNFSDDVKKVMRDVILPNVDNPTEEHAIEEMITACT